MSSTAIDNETYTDEIPDASEIQTYNGMPVWRIGNGALCQGREEDNNLVTKQKIAGRLLRVGVHHDVVKDTGEPYTKLECDLQTSEGVQSIGVKISSKIVSCNLAEGLLAAAKGELILIEANPGTQKNRYGKLGTFCNVYKIDPVTKKTTKLRDTQYANLQLDAKQGALLDAIAEHPAYAERPNRKEADDPWQGLLTDVEKAGIWPAPDGDALDGYLKLATAVAAEAEPPIEINGSGLNNIPSQVWQLVRDGHAECVASEPPMIPPVLEQYLPKKEEAKPKAGKAFGK